TAPTDGPGIRLRIPAVLGFAMVCCPAMRRGIAVGLFACLFIGVGCRVFAEGEYCEGEYCDDVGSSDDVGTSDDTEGDYDGQPHKKQGPSIDIGPIIELIPPLLEHATSRPDLSFTEAA